MEVSKSSVSPSWQSQLEWTMLFPWLCLSRWYEDDKEREVFCLSCGYLLIVETCKQVLFVFLKWCKNAHFCFGEVFQKPHKTVYAKIVNQKATWLILYSWSLQRYIPRECHFHRLQLQECHLIKYSRLQSRMKFHIQIVIPGPKYVGS